MSAHRGKIIGAVLGGAVGLLVDLSVTLIAIGDPGGWAPWRIAVVTAAAIPACAIAGVAFGWVEDS